MSNRIADLKDFLGTALTEVCFGDQDAHPLDATVARYFHPDYRQTSDGVDLDYAGFLDHLRLLRRRVAAGRIEVLDALQDGANVASRHVVSVVKAEGGEIQTEMYAFGRFADDGRLIRMVEGSRMMRGGASDADLSFAR